jgi:predicted dehydrogenase/nucleoside-diphosphate-sugar epimerase
MRRVLLVGAGFISRIHAEVLHSLPGVQLSGVVDRDDNAAAALAERWRIPRVFSSLDRALEAGDIDCAHVLTPPSAHAAAALPFLQARIPVLSEKPLAASGAECQLLLTTAADAGAALGINQNFVYHPAFVRLRRCIAERQLGRPTFIASIFNLPLQQLQARQFGHWMFAEPANILLEQAVHPLSQIVALAGRVEHSAALAEPPREISPGVPLYRSLSVALRCERMPAQLRVAVGQSFPFWQLAVTCDDGVAVADMQNNRFFTYRQTRWLPFIDNTLSGTRTAGTMLRDSVAATADYILSTVKIKPNTDSFFQSMKGSICAFHDALEGGRSPPLDGSFGAHLVAVCEDIAKAIFEPSRRPATRPATGDFEVAALGGTGFIGTHVVKRLIAEGRRVGVMARNIRNLPAVFFDPRVVVMQGNVQVEADVERAIDGARWVVNLAHGGGGRTDDEVRANMVGGAETVARVCLARNVERLVHVGSIAGLYLGPQRAPITGSTPPDPLSDRRNAYSRGKADCDRLLLTLHEREGLPVCILRPGIVVGEGGLAFHSGLGFFNNEQHCLGWNAGRNPLPFVLAEDVAAAIWQACIAPDIAGRAYNLVGDVRLSAREYVAELARALDRPLSFHPKHATVFWSQELVKWAVKRLIRRGPAPAPALRDFLSWGLTATFDCSDIKKDLGWRPAVDREYFIDHGIRVYRDQ